MPKPPLRICAYPGCGEMTRDRFCAEHREAGAAESRARAQAQDKRRGSSRERGYDYRWNKYSKRFLSQPEHQLCVLHLDEGCAIVAQCVDHIDPPDGPNDPRFWDPNNHQPACIHCNSVKGHRKIVGRP